MGGSRVKGLALNLPRLLAACALAVVIGAGHLLTAGAPVTGQSLISFSPPLLYVQPTCLRGGETFVLVHGRNFEPGRVVDVWDFYHTYDFEYGNSVSAVTDEFGTFEVSLQVNLHLSAYHHIGAFYANSATLVELGKLIVGGCRAKIEALPKCSAVPAPEVTISGRDFAIDTTNPITIVIRDEFENVMGRRVIDPAESFVVDIDVTSPARPNGIPGGGYIVSAEQNVDPIEQIYVRAYTYLQLPCPTVSVEPVCSRAGAPPDDMSIVVTASGFLELPLEIVFDPEGEAQEWRYPGPAGSYVITPFRRELGTYTVLVKQGYNPGNVLAGVALFIYPGDTDNRFTEASTLFTVNCAALRTSLQVEPTCGPPQLEGDLPLTYQLRVIAGNFRPGPLTVTFDADGSPERFQVTADSNGEVDRVIPLAGRPDGTYRVVAHQEAAGFVVPDADASFTVPCVPPAARLVSNIPCGPPAAGTPAAYQVRLTGDGFLPGRVELTFDHGGEAPETLPPAVADGEGHFQVTVSPGGRGPATYAILAHQKVADSELLVEISLDFVVACEPPRMTLSSATGPRGKVVTVTGEFFRHDADILLYWSRGIGASRPLPVRSDPNGNFSRQILIFTSDFTGLRSLSAELLAEPLALAELEPVPYFVTAGTVSPPFSLFENPIAAPDATIVLRR